MTTYELPPTPAGVDEEDWRAAVSAIRGYCGWHIAPSVTETLTCDWGGGNLLSLPSMHVTAVQTVTLNGQALTNITWSQRGVMRLFYAQQNRHYASGPYAVGHPSPYLHDQGLLSGLQVALTHGYDEFPAEVLAVARSMSAAGAGSLATKLTSGPHSVDLTPEGIAGAFAMSELHKSVLERFRVKAGS